MYGAFRALRAARRRHGRIDVRFIVFRRKVSFGVRGC